MNTQSAKMMTRLCSCSTLALLLALGAGCFNDPGALLEGPGGASASGGTSLHGVARAQTTTKTFLDYLKPTPITCSPLSSATWGVAGVLPRDLCNGIESAKGAAVPPDYYYWDGQILKAADGKYHMFMSTWAGSAGFNPGWTNSDAYHAISSQGVLGPYQRQGYVYTNSGSHKGHNVSAVELPDGTYAVIVSEIVPFTIYKSSSLDGPWTGCSPQSDIGASNISMFPRHDGKFQIVERHGTIAISDTLCGHYVKQSPTCAYTQSSDAAGTIYPKRTSIPGVTNPTYAWQEDPHIWRSGGTYHVIYSGSGDRVGWHVYSADGVTNWQDNGYAWSPREYQKIFCYEGSTTCNQWYKMERPSVVLQDGHVTHVTWAVSDVDKDNSIPGGSNHGSKIIVVPFDGVAFDNDFGTIPPSNPPTVATAAAASPSPVTGSTTALSVLGADDGGEANLTYTWATTGTPPAAVTFSANGTNAAKATTATFTKAGSYTLQATIKDQGNQTVTSAVTVTVSQTFTSVAVAPTSATVNPSATQQFTATALDQFATSLTTQPTFTWSVSGGGAISSTGLFTAGATVGGPYTVTAQSGGVSGTASVTVSTAPIPVYRIDCGSTSAVSPFTADQYSSGGTQHTVTNTITVSGVTNPAPMAVYQSERYGNMTYTLPNLTAGSQYTVRLHFAELYWTATGKRVFNVAINGTTVLSNFDVYAAAGGNYKALVREFSATANSSGQIVIQFTTVTDNATIEGIEILTSTPNGAPSIATAAAASPNPVTGSTTALSVLGADDGGEANLTYTWATTGTPPAAVTFSANGSNAAKNTTATFSKAGSYSFQVTVKDQPGLAATSTVAVTINQTLTSIVVSPTSATVNTSATQQFTATARDQFATNLATQPTFTWTVSGGGTISTNGLFTAGTTAGGPYTVTAQSGTVSGTASVTVGSTVVYQINCGSSSAASPFKADQYGSGGTQRTVSNTITISGITNPAPQAVYQSERYGNSTYTLPSLTPGAQYTVRLHFAELYWTATGKRVFNVLINSTSVLSNFDVYATAGGNYKAVLREFTATASSSGQIVINFNTVTDNATIEGIEIIRK